MRGAYRGGQYSTVIRWSLLSRQRQEPRPQACSTPAPAEERAAQPPVSRAQPRGLPPREVEDLEVELARQGVERLAPQQAQAYCTLAGEVPVADGSIMTT